MRLIGGDLPTRHSRCFTVAPKHNQFPRMRRHTLPCQVSDLLSFAERIANELDTHGRWLEIIGIRADELRCIADQVKKAEAAWSAAKSAKASAQTRTTAADEALTAWLAKARLVVMLARGEKWSERWIEAGFTHRRMNVPKRVGSRVELARRLVVFLALQPEFGVRFAGVTATEGRSIYTRVIQTRYGLEKATADCAMTKRQRDAAERIVRHTLRRVALNLPSNDSHVLAFGLNEAAESVHDRPDFAKVSGEPIPVIIQAHSDCQQTVAA